MSNTVSERKALIVGINEYTHPEYKNLDWAVDDAEVMHEVLSQHADGSHNFECGLMTTNQGEVREDQLFNGLRDYIGKAEPDSEVLFYFSGHGHVDLGGGSLVGQDARDGNIGITLDQIINLCKNSKAKSIVLMLDCCHSGALGTSFDGEHSVLRNGVTIMTSASDEEDAYEQGGHGRFTKLLIDGLEAGAGDIRGQVTPAALYHSVIESFGSWKQTPLFKTNESRRVSLRQLPPLATDELLNALPKLFGERDFDFLMDPSFEHTEPNANPDHVKIFDQFKDMRNAGLLYLEKDLYWLAKESGVVRLSPQGKRYWELAKYGLIGGRQADSNGQDEDSDASS